MWKTSLVCAGLIGIGLSAAMLAARDTKELTGDHLLPPYRLAEVSRGRAVTRVLAAGTVQPVVSVVVSSQLSGQVQEILVDAMSTSARACSTRVLNSSGLMPCR